jgi:DNA-binding SARP family transcriptional activator
MRSKPRRMIEWRVLGAIDLRDSDGAEMRPVLAQAKRLAVLIYLALARPRGFHRRDTLVGLFWPELDTAHARHALSQALQFCDITWAIMRLRQGAARRSALTQNGYGTMRSSSRVGPRGFAAAEAMALYRGDLLEGFFLTDAPAFDHWLEGERARLRERAARTARRLAEQLEDTGDLNAAVQWARRAAELVPYDEAMVRQVIRLLDDAGDRAGALRTADRFARWVAAEFDASPAPETQALIDQTRRRASPAPDRSAPHGTLGPQPVLVLAAAERPGEAEALPEVGPPTAPPIEAAMASRAAAGRPARTRRRVLLGASAVLLAAAAPLVWKAVGVRPAPAAPEAVAIFRFAVRGEGYEYLGEGMASLLSTKLDGAGGLRSVDPRATLGLVEQAGGGVPDIPRAQAVATRLGAGRFVLGEIVAAGDRLHIEAAIYDPAAGRQPVSRASVEGAADGVLELVDALAAGLLADLRRRPSERLTRAAALTTSSLPALKAYLEGERQFRLGQFDAAVDAFTRAVVEDSTFALAYYRLSTAAEWLGDTRLAHSAADRAVQFGQRLPPLDRTLLQALLATRSGDAERAEYLYRQVLASGPHDLEAWFQLGEVLFHYGPLTGRPIRESRRAWEKVLEFEPDNVGAQYHLARLAALDGDHRQLHLLAARIAALAPAHERAWATRVLAVVVSDDRAAVDRILGELRDVGDLTLYMAAFDATTFGRDPGIARAIVRLLTEPHRPVDMRAWGHLWLAHLDVAGGRWRDAQRELVRLASLDPIAALEYRALLALNPLLRLPATELDEIRSALAAAEPLPSSMTSPDFPSAIHVELRPHLNTYLQALIGARAGDHAALAQAAVMIDARESPGSSAARLATSLRATAALLASDPVAAQDLLEEARLRGYYEPARWSAFLGQVHERFLRAEALEQLGDEGAALGWYEALTQTSALEIAYLAPRRSGSSGTRGGWTPWRRTSVGGWAPPCTTRAGTRRRRRSSEGRPRPIPISTCSTSSSPGSMPRKVA